MLGIPLFSFQSLPLTLNKFSRKSFDTFLWIYFYFSGFEERRGKGMRELSNFSIYCFGFGEHFCNFEFGKESDYACSTFILNLFVHMLSFLGILKLNCFP